MLVLIVYQCKGEGDSKAVEHVTMSIAMVTFFQNYWLNENFNLLQ